jgi:hypothetical protein
MIDSQDIRTLPSAIERLSAPGPFAPAKASVKTSLAHRLDG